MAPTPFRRRKTARTARSVALLQAGLALAGPRSSRRRRRRGPGRLIAALGLAAAGAAGILGRDRIAGLLPGRSGDGSAPGAPVPPQASNYDAPGPDASTATPAPAPEQEEAEGQDQAGAEPAANALLRDQPPSDAEPHTDDAAEAKDEPATGERPEPLAPLDVDMDPTAGEGGGISGRPGARLDDVAETPGVPPTGSPATEPQTGDDDEDRGGGETWSGRPA